MAQKFETITTRRATAQHVRQTVAQLRDVPEGLALKATGGQVMALGERRWTFLLTQEAAERWEVLGHEPLTLAVLAFHNPETDEPYVERVLVALPGRKGQVNLEWRDNHWRVVYKGSGRLRGGELIFSMPITRARVAAKGLMAGRLSRTGQLRLTQARLPRPTKKLRPSLESKE